MNHEANANFSRCNMRVTLRGIRSIASSGTKIDIIVSLAVAKGNYYIIYQSLPVSRRLTAVLQNYCS